MTAYSCIATMQRNAHFCRDDCSWMVLPWPSVSGLLIARLTQTCVHRRVRSRRGDVASADSQRALSWS
jgi:hypothetical protein